MIKSIILWLFSSVLLLGGTKQCTITMGYKPKPKKPYIFADNSGIYRDVYGEALKRIGCKLKIVRLPKLRIIQHMKRGTIDFYPALTFTQERAVFVAFIPSHIDHSKVLVTRKLYPAVESLEKLISLKPTLLKETGGYSALEGLPTKRFETTDLDISKKMRLLLKRRIDAFGYPLKTLEYYLKAHPDEAKNIRVTRFLFEVDLRVHTLGFSRFSAYYADKPNVHFAPRRTINQENMPTALKEDSIAYQFARMLERMDTEGRIKQIYDRYRLKAK